MSEPTPTAEAAEPTSRSWAKTWGVIGAIAVLLIGLEHLLVSVVLVEGGSMEPTLSSGQRLLALHHAEIARRDVIVFKNPLDPRELMVKRVLGLPGDRVRFAAGRLYVDDVPQEEPYLRGSPDPEQDLAAQDVPDGYYYVLGDNRRDSRDSRHIGLIPHHLVVGWVWRELPAWASR